jgi:transposase
MPNCVGLDWGGAGHAVCVIDDGGHVLTRIEARHDAEGLADLLARLARIAPAGELPVAIERPSGLLVDTLAAAGHPIVPIHPNVVKACRPRYRSAGKSDPGDAYILADILRTDGHRFRPLAPVSDEIRALRALVRGRDDLVAQRVALANQLRALLQGFWPAAAAVFADIDSAIALNFIRRYPTPNSASRLGEKRMASFLAQNAYCGRRSPAELIARIQAAPAGHTGQAEASASGQLASALAGLLQNLLTQIARLTAQIEHTVAQLPDGKIVMSFPRAGRVCAAQILAELGNVRERFQTHHQLAAEAGVAPITRQSGKYRSVVFRWACNKRLRNAITGFADNSRHASQWANAVYQNARKRGCRHAHAIRILAKAWIRVIWRAWTDNKTYDPTKHNAANNLNLI